MITGVTLLALLAIGAPVAFAIALGLVAYISTGTFGIDLLPQRIFAGMDSFTILAIPLFVLAGELMNASGITSRVINLANALVGHAKAGLAQVNIWSSVIFAGLSGSAVADTSAIGRIFIPSMEKEGYPRDFAAALTAASSVIGPIIPPSIPVIIYALITTNVSVPALFLAGIVPGILLAIALSVYVRFFVKNYAKPRERMNMGEKLKAVWNGLIPLFMPVFVIGSILAGIVTPTEAASFAVFYALVVGLFVFRELKPSDLPGIFSGAMRDSSSILIIMATVAAANWFMTFAGIPQSISKFVLGYVDSPATFLILINLMLLAVGLVLEGIAAMLVLVPILHPIAISLGIDPTHFGIIVIFNLMIGLITPPMGLCLFVADAIAGVGMARMIRAIMPFFIVELMVLILITFVPDIVTFLPNLFGF
ncbi:MULTISPECIES: TRAP transporter large permease [Thalassospira]|jgi:tripartite ATP-independent transporter DctM subunit|uniref:TRAP transporter large permease protein n=2 Tax=Thalassospira TaxID=168934 RepID=A0A8I1M4U6_9PROT|nr:MULTISPECIES: TRAP transporter large permease [Thalassospira]RCK28380.1 C4-dicarboxylate ABC transporter permease [Thalassospira profundimaris]MAL39674.1 C4-dicarboxylate ABC transporter permease [Thalassospira sp.]MBN8194959.1 TRAP transporter large permease [Thalassospira povalilytica]URK16409.1 TRAP transporter large permease [Thalassospira sp. GO-4]HAY47816.1 C4-dicarboxylate ABC transporter permease [Thalassospira sp.]|tara:strand:+ start:1928 stop:3196 length:1269 start_codon:yes stop_codon:yes gene_type:complete